MAMNPAQKKAARGRTNILQPAAARVRARPRTQAGRSAETKLRLVEASARLIGARGYARLRTADVADAAGVSRGAMLHHFPTKNALVVATLEHVFERALHLSRTRAAALAPAGDLVAAVIEDAREFFFNEHFRVSLDIVLSTSTDASLRNRILSISRKARLPVEAAWTQALEARGVPRATADNLIALTLALVRGMSIRALWDQDEERVGRLFDLWRQMVGAMLQTRRR
jgi:AcrR family transcriptional regulator